MRDIDRHRLKCDEDLARPQVAAVLDVLVRGVEIEGKVVEGYQNLCKKTHKKADDLTLELSAFLDKYADANAASAASFAKGLMERIYTRRLHSMLKLYYYDLSS